MCFVCVPFVFLCTQIDLIYENKTPQSLLSITNTNLDKYLCQKSSAAVVAVVCMRYEISIKEHAYCIYVYAWMFV